MPLTYSRTLFVTLSHSPATCTQVLYLGAIQTFASVLSISPTFESPLLTRNRSVSVWSIHISHSSSRSRRGPHLPAITCTIPGWDVAFIHNSTVSAPSESTELNIP